MIIYNAIINTYEGDIMSGSLRQVFGCFCMVSSCPSSGLRNWICCGDGTGIRLASLEDCLLPPPPPPPPPIDICRPNIPSVEEMRENNIQYTIPGHDLAAFCFRQRYNFYLSSSAKAIGSACLLKATLVTATATSVCFSLIFFYRREAGDSPC